MIGGGLVGRLAAVVLERLGYAVTLYLGAPTGSGVARPRSLFLWSSALSALATADRRLPTAGRGRLVDVVRVCGEPIERMDILAWSGARLSALPIGALGRGLGQPTIVVEPDALLDALASLFAGPPVACEVKRIEPGRDWSSFTIHTDTHPAVTYNGVLVAGGRGSKFRKMIQDRPPEPRPAFQDAFVGVYDPAITCAPRRLLVGSSQTVLGPRARIWLTPIKDDHTRRGRIAWYATVKRERGVQGPRVWNLAGLRELFACGPEFASQVLADSSDVASEPIAIDDVPPTRPWVRGSFALLGDAAHAPTPDLGFGACLGIEGVMTLAHLCRAKADWHAALLAYEAQHFPRARRLVELSRAAALLSMPESRLADAGRDLLTSRLFAGFATDDLRHLLAYQAWPA